ncbi:MAG TPA: tetratricopeptide repeat protein [Terriglobia bacterium]|nr:tetratricopeptide repeat protein [Terriglobia bacterium]
MVALFLAASAVTTILAQDTKKAPSSDPTSALEFLGSYSAPSAVLATETSHTSAHPPSPSADRRLRELSSARTLLPPWPTDFVWSVQSIEAACGHPALLRSEGTESAEPSDPARVSQTSKLRLPIDVHWVQLVVGANRALQDGRYADAGNDYERILIERPACSPIAWNRALARAYARNPEALTDLLAVLPSAPFPASGSIPVALELLASGDFDRAGGYLDPLRNSSRASILKPRERDLLWAKAAWLRFTGDPERAYETLERLANLEPGAAAVWFALGSVALEEAREYSGRLAQIAPGSSWNRRLEAEALATRYPYLAHRLWPGVGAPSRSIVEAGIHPPVGGPDSPEQLFWAAHSALQTAVKAYAMAARSPDFSAELHGLKALAAEQEDDEAAAFREYRAGLAEDPSSAILHAGLGHLYRERSQFEDANRELTRALRLDPSDPVVTFELGDVYLRLGDAARSLDLLNRAIELDPALLVARWSRGKTYSALGDDQRAASDLAAAAPVDSTGELQWQLARVYHKLGRTELAQVAEQRSEEQRRTHGRPPKTEDPRP